MQMELKNGGGKLMEINLNLKFEGKKRYRRSFRRDPTLKTRRFAEFTY